MSRIGRKAVPLTKDVKVQMKDRLVTVVGPKGTLKQELPAGIDIEVDQNEVRVVNRIASGGNALHGLSRSLINNMIAGVVSGFKKELVIIGVGYRAQVTGKNLILNLGYNEPINYPIPDGMNIAVTDNTKVSIEGIDRQQVGQVAANIRQFRKPEPYKGKGIRYADEQITLKEGKTV